jgi:hypothetical protein
MSSSASRPNPSPGHRSSGENPRRRHQPIALDQSDFDEMSEDERRGFLALIKNTVEAVIRAHREQQKKDGVSSDNNASTSLPEQYLATSLGVTMGMIEECKKMYGQFGIGDHHPIPVDVGDLGDDSDD